jgi:iron complex outermembrane receptor protein
MTAARKSALVAFALLLAFAAAGTDRSQRYQLVIERGSVAAVLEQLSMQTGLQVITELNVNGMRPRDFGPVAGNLTAHEALRALFEGTELWYRWQSEDAIRVFRIEEFGERPRSIGRTTAKEASLRIQEIGGAYYQTGACSELPVGPFESDDLLSPELFWIELIKPHCSVVWRRLGELEPGSINRHTAVGETEHSFSIDEMPRILAVREIWQQFPSRYILYLSSDDAEDLQLVGPIRGEMTLNEALQHLMRNSTLRARWVDDETVMIEPAYKMVAYADMSSCPLGCNFGLPEFRPVQSAHVTVEKSRLPSLDELVAAPVFVGDQDWIASSGATTIPELFQYIPQFAFYRGAGYRLSGAQFFEGGRGLGPEYTLVLINGRRAFGSAADPMVSAFDLNFIPLTAVRRIEFSFDQPSLVHGTDAIGGTVNIVLNEELRGIAADALLGSADGGATQRRVALTGGHHWGRLSVGAVLDYFDKDELLGAERGRLSNQDFTRYGGADQRSTFAGPPNVRAISGNLPGTNSPTAAMIFDDTGRAALDTSTLNHTSLRSYQAIEPDTELLSLYGFVDADITDSLTVHIETLLGRRTAHYQLAPTILPGVVWGADHRENPFAIDVLIETALTGFPIQTFETQSKLRRGLAELSGSLDNWDYVVFGLSQNDESQAGMKNVMDMISIMRSLGSSDISSISVLSCRPGEGTDPSAFTLPRQISHLTSDAKQFGAWASGPIMKWARSKLMTEIGAEHRAEAILFDPRVGSRSRSIDSAFAQLRLQLAQGVTASAGTRRDEYSDLQGVSRQTYGIAWQLSPALKVAATTSRHFRPPSMYDLYFPQIATPTQVMDPLRNELSPLTVIAGGNTDLRPTRGQSASIEVTWLDSESWRVSASWWQIEMADRVAVPNPQLLLAVRDDDLTGRVSRAPATPVDVANGRPGRLISLDVSRGNFGKVRTNGVDVTLEKQVESTIGRIGARLDFTHVLSFKDSTLPLTDSPLRDRVGRAAVEGTIPHNRAVLSLSYSRGPWEVILHARHGSGVDDYGPISGSITGRTIRAQTILDAQVSREVAGHATVTLGANNVLDDLPPFAEVSGDYGYDISQGNIIGRTGYLKLNVAFP